jgi:sec-independent protein translocase protein TatB
MFDIGWSEMAVVALLALIVIGPKDLPRVLRSASIRKARGLAREFQSGVDEMIREADLEDAKKVLDDAKRLDFDKALEDTLDPTGEVKDEVRSIENTARDAGKARAETHHEADDDAPTAGATSPPAEQQDEEASGATIVEQPLRVAPPHSLEPPSGDAPAASATGKKAAGKKASRKKADDTKAAEKTA